MANPVKDNTAETSVELHELGRICRALEFGFAAYRPIDDGADFVFVEFSPLPGIDADFVARADALGERVTDVFPGVRKMGLLCALQRVAHGGGCEVMEPQQYTDSRMVRWLVNHLIPLPGGLVGAFYRDVTEEIAALEGLNESETRYRLLTESMIDGIWDWDVEQGTVYFSPSWKAQLGYRDDELSGGFDTFATLLHPSDRESVLNRVSHFVSDPEGIWEAEFRMQQKSGTYRWIQARGSAVHDDEGKVVRLLGVHVDIEERKSAERRMKETMRELRMYERVASTTSELMSFVDSDYVYRMVNDAYLRMHGRARETLVGRRVEEVMGTLAFERYIRPNLDRCFAGEVVTYEAEFEFAVGPRFVEVSYRPYRDQGAVMGAVVVVRDITELREARVRLRQAAQVFRSTVEGVVISDLEGTILDVNEAFTRITGYSRDQAIGGNPRILKSGRHGDSFYEKMYADLATKGAWRGEIWNRRANGEVYPEQLAISTVRNDAGEPTGYVAVFSDITATKEAASKLEFLAHHDPLTRLPNRLLLHARLSQSLNIASRAHTRLAVLFIDIDRFKQVNDSLGHARGDDLLVQIAERLKSVVREEDTLARISGDEFVAVCRNVDSSEQAATVVGRIMGQLETPFKLSNDTVHVTCSIGVSLYPQDGEVASVLMRNADAAMYRAKESGRNTFRFYSEDMSGSTYEHLLFETALRKAVDREEFRLVYQPQFDLSDGSVVGVEALLRWNQRHQGPIEPSRFVPVAERSGLIRDIGKWVIRHACWQASQWAQEGVEFGRMAINISVDQLKEPDFFDEFITTIEEFGVSPNSLEVEVTETSVMSSAEASIQHLVRLSELGVVISVDDFGTGYSSLASLKLLPIHKLKLDRSFVQNLPDDPDDCAIADAIVALGNALDLEVVAEGIEAREQADYLLSRGCKLVQGFLYGRPMSAADVACRIRQREAQVEQ